MKLLSYCYTRSGRVLAKVQSQVPIKSSVECAPIYKEAETTSKNRNHNLKRSSVPIFTDYMTLVYTSIPVRVVRRNCVSKELYSPWASLWQEVLGRTNPLLSFYYNFSIYTKSRKQTLICMPNEVIKTIQFGRLSANVTDGSDLWSKQLRWHQMAWYTYQVSWRLVPAFR
jgi:hypothetical protein